MKKIERALISVSDKTGIAELAMQLSKRGVEIISTGGTAKLLKGEGVPIKTIDEFTGFPEMLDGRVKTLHPKVHAGLLSMRDNPTHQRIFPTQVSHHLSHQGSSMYLKASGSLSCGAREVRSPCAWRGGARPGSRVTGGD